jgi:adenylate cyclase class IV
VHLDRVEHLGEFLEFEVVLRPDQTEADGEAIAAMLADEFGLMPPQMIAGAYVDLLS